MFEHYVKKILASRVYDVALETPLHEARALSNRVGNRVFLTYSRSLSSSTRDQVIVVEIDQTDRLSWILSRNEDGTYALDLTMRGTF